MDTTGMHYIHYDPEAIWKLIFRTYIANGGDILYPGDEKDALLRTVQALLVQGLSIADNALLMDSLQHTADEYMDLYGQKRNCYRIEAQAAEAAVEIIFAPGATNLIIPAGTALTADGQRIYKTKSAIEQTAYAQKATAAIVAEESGAAGNGLKAGTEMQFCTSNPGVLSMTVITDATGGHDREKDESYRERIREYGLASITTGPRQQYEQRARSVSADILDAKAVQTAPCAVCVYLIIAENADAEALQSEVLTALSGETDRPLTDLLTIAMAEEVSYTLNVNITLESSIPSATLTEVVNEYQAWQDNEIARHFNPDKLMAMLYQAGVSRVQWAEGSNFNGGTVEYKAIGASQRCAGTIALHIV